MDESADTLNAIEEYRRLVDTAPALADALLDAHAEEIGYAQAAWHMWRFRRFSPLEALRNRLLAQFRSGRMLPWAALECLYMLQEQQRTGSPAADRSLQCEAVFAELCRAAGRMGERFAIGRDLVWHGLIEDANASGLPDYRTASVRSSYGSLSVLDRLLMEAGRLNRSSVEPATIVRSGRRELRVVTGRPGGPIAAIHVGPYYFRNPDATTRTSARLPPGFRSPFRSGLRQLIALLFDNGWGIRPYIAWRGGIAPPSFSEDMSFTYHTRGWQAGRWHYKFGHFSDLMQVDPAGYAGFAAFADRTPQDVARRTAHLSDAEVERRLAPYRQRYIHQRFSWREQSPRQDLSHLRGSGRTFFFPLQDPLDEVSELAWMSSAALLGGLLAALPAGDRLIVKRHPLDASRSTDRLISGLAGDPRVTIASASIHDLFEVCDGVVTINSGVGFEALLAGLPVIAAGKSDYNLAAVDVHSTAEIAGALNRLGRDPPLAWRNRVVYDYFDSFALDPENEPDFRQRLADTLGLEAGEDRCRNLFESME